MSKIRTLIGNWEPPAGSVACLIECQGTREQSDTHRPKQAADDPRVVPVVVVRDSEHTIAGGIYFQRCGGGRRVIRKRIGSA